MDNHRNRHSSSSRKIKNEFHYAKNMEEMARELEDSTIRSNRPLNHTKNHDDRRRHDSNHAAGRNERSNSGSSKSGKEFILFSNRFSKEKLSRTAVATGKGLDEFLRNNSPSILKNVWEKTLKPRNNIPIDHQRPSSSMQDSRNNQNDYMHTRIISPSEYNEHQNRTSLDSRIQSMCVPGADVPELGNINTRHKNDDRCFMGDNREQVPMDIGSEDEGGPGTPISDESMTRRDHYASNEINHNYVKNVNAWHMDLEPLPYIKEEPIKQEMKQEYNYVDNTRRNESTRRNERWSPVRLPRNGTLENYSYEENVGSNQESRKDSSNRSAVNDIQNSEEIYSPLPPETVVKNLNEAIPMSWHCQIYLSGLKCHKGDYCDKLHKFPRENGVRCRDFLSGHCNRKAEECWFEHPGEVVEETEMDDEAPFVVQPMGELMKYIKKEIAGEPNKYKSKVDPKKMLPPVEKRRNANMIPLGARKEKSRDQNRNPNMVPLGPKRVSQEQEVDHYSPLQPRRSSTSTSYTSNPSQGSPILSPRSNTPLSYTSTSPLDSNRSKPNVSLENCVSNNIDEETRIVSPKGEKDMSKNKYQFIKNAHKSISDVDSDDKQRKHKKKKNDKTDEDNLSPFIDGLVSESDKDKRSEEIDSVHDTSKDKKSKKSKSVDEGSRDKDKRKEEKKEREKKVFKAIDELLDKAANGIEGDWKKSSDRERDLLDILELSEIQPFNVEETGYSKTRVLELNFRQVYLRFCGVNSKGVDVQEHAKLFKKRYPDCDSLLDEHSDDISCCKS